MAKRNRDKNRKNSPASRRQTSAPKTASTKPAKKVESQPPAAPPTSLIAGSAAVAGLVFIWAYLPTWGELIGQWNRVPDYSHGFLVLPLAGFFMWIRRDRFPGFSFDWRNLLGLLIIALASVMRYISAYYYLDAFDGWSIPLWISGFVLLFGGWRIFWWALPSVAFLIFMVPLPYTIETAMAVPLQFVSTQASSFILQCLGQPAVTEGSTILLGDQTLEIVRACSGLRILFGVAALAYAFMILFERPFWAKILMMIGILPVALLANSIRIVLTGILYQIGLNEAANRISHDVAGWVMIPLAALMFAALLFYLDRLFRRLESVDSAGMVRAQTQRH